MSVPRKEELVKSLCRLSASLCSYNGQPCDCKYMKDNDTSIARGQENGSGCPETMVAAELIANMTIQEFHALLVRAGLTVDEEPVQPIANVYEMKKAFQKELWEKERTNALKLRPTKIKRKSYKSAYVPGKLPKGLL